MANEGEEGRGRPGDPPAVWAELGRYAGFGITLAVATGLFLLAGWWLDKWAGTTPLLTVLGALLGAAAGFYHMYQHLILMPRSRERSRSDPEGKGSG